MRQKSILSSLISTNPPIPLSNLEKQCKSIFRSNFQNYWSQIPHSNKLKRIKKTLIHGKIILSPPEKSILLLQTYELVILYPTDQHLFLRKFRFNCPSSNTVIIVHHVLLDCPAYNHHRTPSILSQKTKHSKSSQAILNTWTNLFFP